MCTRVSSRTHAREKAAGPGQLNYFSPTISMRFLAVFLYVFRGYRPHLIKMPKGNALIFQLKKDFVFRAQPRFPEHGSVNWPWCAERKSTSLFLPISATGMTGMLKKITKNRDLAQIEADEAEIWHKLRFCCAETENIN